MATALDQIVPVSVQLGSIVPSQVAFSVPLIAAQFNSTKITSFTGRTKVYVSLAGLLADGWLTTDSVYLYAQALLSQNPSVQKFIVGRRTVSPDSSPDADWATALTAIQNENPNWYGFVVVPTSATLNTIITEQLQIAAWAETAHRPFFTDSNDATILSSGSGDAGSQIAALSRNYTMVSYHAPAVATASSTVTGGASQATATAATDATGVVTLTFNAAFVASNVIAGSVNGQSYSVPFATSDTATFAALVTAFNALTGTQAVAVNGSQTYATRSIKMLSSAAGSPTTGESVSAAWLGFLLPLSPGSWNPSYRQLAATTPDTITGGQKVVAGGKKVNTFSSVAGLNFTERGYVAGGSYGYIDITFGVDWLTTNLQTAYIQVLASPQKVPFTDAGGILLQSVGQGVMATAAAMGIVDPASVAVTVPKVATISSVDKAARNFPGVTILARVQGAVNTVPVSLTLSF
jgi:hypothetical protein